MSHWLEADSTGGGPGEKSERKAWLPIPGIGFLLLSHIPVSSEHGTEEKLTEYTGCPLSLGAALPTVTCRLQLLSLRFVPTLVLYGLLVPKIYKIDKKSFCILKKQIL